MKRSEYKKEVNRLIKLSKELDKRIDIQFLTAMWITEKIDLLSNKIDDSSNDWQQKEELIKKAEELMGRLLLEKRTLEKDNKLENMLYRGLDELTLRIVKEGIEKE